jgi:hypothetical protein
MLISITNKPHVFVLIVIPVLNLIIPYSFDIIRITTYFILIPILLLALGLYSLFRTTMINKFLTFSIFAILVGNLFGYLRWGIFSGRILSPDIKTIEMIKWILLFQISSVLMLAVILLIKSIIEKSKYVSFE